MFKVSQSKVKTWRKCRQAYHQKYVEGLRRKKPSRPLKFGTLAHAVLESQAKKKDWEETLDAIAQREAKALADGREEYGNIIEDLRVIMREYFDYNARDKLTYVPVKKVLAEHLFEVPLVDGIVFKGKIDGFAKTGNGLSWLVEHKSFSRMPSEDHRWRNLQSASYLWVAEKHMGVRLDGTLWDYIYSKPPTVPALLKSGDTSISQIDTLPSVVKATLRERGQLKDPKYASLIKNATESRKKWFQRIHTRKRKEVTTAVMDDFIETAKEMQALHGKSQSRTIDRHCDWCEYEPLCRAMLQGLDVNFIKKTEYYHEENEFDYHESQTEE